MHILGLDIGGSGIKGAIVDTQTGQLLSERHRIPTPQPPTPEAITDTIACIVAHFQWKGPVGCGFPAVVKDGVIWTAANISERWIGLSAQTMFERATDTSFHLINDADAAGLAEVHFGSGHNKHGLILVVTLGTGIGTSLFINGQLIPNLELGHIEMEGKEAEKYASSDVRKTKHLSWNHWAKRLDKYLHTMEDLLWPDLIIIGGGVSKRHEKFLPLLTIRTSIIPASLLNEAGIIGAALAAQQEPAQRKSD